MGSASVPSSTSQYQQQAMGIWGSPQATALALPILKPALRNIKEQQTMLAGFQHGDPEQTAKFFGLPADASTEDMTKAISRVGAGTTTTAAAPIYTGQRPQAPQNTQPTQAIPALPEKLAARGGLMSLGNDEPETDPRRSFAKAGSTTPKPTTKAQDTWLSNYSNIKNPTKAQQAKANRITQQQTAYTDYTNKSNAIQKAATAQGITPSSAYLGQAGYAGLQRTGTDAAGNPIYSVTQESNPYLYEAAGMLRGMETQPGQFGQATDAYNAAISGLQGAAGYTPQNVAAQQAVASSYDASQMRGPQNVSAQGYDAAQMQGATMQGAQDVAANRLQQYQMDRGATRDINAQLAQAAMMSGPQSWTQQGVAEAYMNPYVKTALKSQQELANYDLQENLNKIMGQAAGAGAYGGSRTQLQLANTRMNQDLANRNMAAQALSQAYGQGMSQFQNESALAQQAKGSNQAALNTAYNNYVAQQLAAQQANQGMDYNTALQNLQAKLGVQSTQQQADLQAALANQMYGYGGYQSQAQNLASLNQAAAANMQALNNQRSQYVTQALQAAQGNQQAALTTEQQNMIARNAAAQFNADNASRISQANAQLGTQAAIANQSAGLQANQQNIGALSQAAGAAQGLGALGTQVGNYNSNLANLWAQGGSMLQGLGSTYFDQMNKNAANVMNAPGGFAGQGSNLLSGAGGTAGTTINTGTQGSAF